MSDASRPRVVKYNVIELPEDGGGQGSISLFKRMQNGEIMAADVEALQQAVVDGKYLSGVSGFETTKCGDGRKSAQPTSQACQVFGGTAGIAKSLRMAQAFGSADSAARDISAFVELRHDKGLRSGDHRAPTGGHGCGCGECDGADSAMKLVAGSDAIKGLVGGLYEALAVGDRNSLPGSMDSSVYERVANQTAQLSDAGYFRDGAAQVDAIDQAEPDVMNIEDLEGQHQEVLWVINLVSNATLDREQLVKDFAEKKISLFWEDQWAIEQELQTFADAADQYEAALIADLTRRVATAVNLTAADLRIVILQ